MMFVMASLCNGGSPTVQDDYVLVALYAFPDGSLTMRPGFSSQDKVYKFEDKTGTRIQFSTSRSHDQLCAVCFTKELSGVVAEDVCHAFPFSVYHPHVCVMQVAFTSTQ